MASYKLNRRAVAHARKLIDARQVVLDSDWGETAPTADDENAFLKSHSWDEYALWHLGLTDGASDETKARYAFVFGDLRRVHRTAVIACVYRAAEWRHKAIELAAHRLLQHLDKTTGLTRLPVGNFLSTRAQAARCGPFEAATGPRVRQSGRPRWSPQNPRENPDSASRLGRRRGRQPASGRERTAR